MADFCLECSDNMFGEGYCDFIGVTLPETWARGEACVVLCEGCGWIQVAPNGACVSEDCLKKDNPDHIKVRLQSPWIDDTMAV